jgi:hypothetical protein
MNHSPLPWKVRVHPVNPNEFFVEASRLQMHHPTNIEVMADDHGGEEYPTAVKRADADFIVKACNNHDRLVDALSNLMSAVSGGCRPDYTDSCMREAGDVLKEVRS